MGMRTLFRPGDRCDLYEILRLIGIGGFAEVYEVAAPPVHVPLPLSAGFPPSSAFATTPSPTTAPALSSESVPPLSMPTEHFALKVLRQVTEPKLLEQLRERIAQEAEATSMVEHVNVVRYYGGGIYRGPDSSHIYLILELVRGPNLRQVLSTGKLDLERIVTIFRHAAEGVDAIHRKGIIHRDLKPENILIGPGDVAKVGDLGSAKLPGWGAQTTPDQQIGSALYMSPEQVRSLPLTPLADVYAMGYTVYETVLGRHPFPKGSLAVICGHQLNTEPPPLSTFGIRADLSEIVQRAMSKDPAKRCTMREFAETLEGIQQQQSHWRRQAARSLRSEQQNDPRLARTENAIPIPEGVLPTLPRAPDVIVSKGGTLIMTSAPVPSPSMSSISGDTTDRAAQLPTPSAPFSAPLDPSSSVGPLFSTLSPSSAQPTHIPSTLRSAGVGEPLVHAPAVVEPPGNRRSSTSPIEQAKRPSAATPRSRVPLVMGAGVGLLAAAAIVTWMMIGGAVAPRSAAPPTPPTPAVTATASPMPPAATAPIAPQAPKTSPSSSASSRTPTKRGVGR
jgi:serine/threonine-protein kinase